MSGIGVLALPAVALLITTGIFVYQLRLYLRARKKNQKPNIPNFNIGPLPSPIPVAPVPQKHTEKKIPQPIKKANTTFYYAAALVGVSLVIVMFVTLSDEPFTFIPRASSPSPTLGISPTLSAQSTPTGNLGTNPSPSSVPINYALTPTVSGSPTIAPSVTQAGGTPQPTKTPTAAPPTTTPRPTKAASASPSPTPTPKTIAYVPNAVRPSSVSAISPTLTPTTRPQITTTPGVKVTVTSGVTGQVGEIPQSGIINPSLFLLLAGGFILFLGFLF
ncbi:hypothetical protein COU89_01790 [Candidatus Roizmanbacteria bacterium CG10_big_fil_rev_8_21_14_0_10_45_7]|uniref:Uncharacterized protein n=1 Tax=Candidatus Roizmanbacteria bacterium CG10_big_fil_rev_8_21_14_0_10_45_7 TaxID=1974854 RepID=A0A2M8KUV8_9BACT|nr:MAG: hypothetical protein COU89_01790 [Candidatus Roizmanbacteria bacterium CG10_big_fil_rev_8_21_14_0_10_45_7]